MGVASKYWILVRIDSFSRCKSEILEAAKVFFDEQFSTIVQQKEIPDRNIQRQLIQWYQSNDPRGEMAEKCLHCFISNVLKESCMFLEQKFGEKYYIYSAELLPSVLDTTHNSQESESLTTHILSTFNPDKSNLST